MSQHLDPKQMATKSLLVDVVKEVVYLITGKDEVARGINNK